MKMQKGSVVRLSARGMVKADVNDAFLYTRSYYTAEYFITFGRVTCVVFEEDLNEYKYPVDWFDVVTQKTTQEVVVAKVDDIIAKQDFIPSEIDELCNLLSSWNGYIIEKEGI